MSRKGELKMNVYHENQKELSDRKFKEIKTHLSNRLNSSFSDNDVFCLLVETYYNKNKEAIDLSNK